MPTSSVYSQELGDGLRDVFNIELYTLHVLNVDQRTACWPALILAGTLVTSKTYFLLALPLHSVYDNIANMSLKALA